MAASTSRSRLPVSCCAWGQLPSPCTCPQPRHQATATAAARSRSEAGGSSGGRGESLRPAATREGYTGGIYGATVPHGDNDAVTFCRPGQQPPQATAAGCVSRNVMPRASIGPPQAGQRISGVTSWPQARWVRRTGGTPSELQRSPQRIIASSTG